MSWTIKSREVFEGLREDVVKLVDSIYEYDTDPERKNRELRQLATERLIGIELALQRLQMIRPEDRSSFIYMVNHTVDLYGYPVKKEKYIKRTMQQWDGVLRRSDKKETPQAGEKGGEPVRSEER